MPEKEQTCCICMEKCIYYQKINEYGFGNSKIMDKLLICAPNQQWEEIFIICNYCVDKLDTTYDFIQLCLKSEAYRKEQLRNKDLISYEEIESEDTNTNFTCYDCNKSFRLKRTLGLHITRTHIRPKKNARRKSFLKEDSSSTVKNDVRTDGEGDKDFDLKPKHEKHMVGTTEEGCDNKESILGDTKDFSDFEVNDNDYSSEEENDIKEKKPYTGKKRGPKLKGPQKCQYCELEFRRTDRYVHHVRSKHTFEKPFKCNLCDAKYFSQHNLNIHMRKHRNEKPFVCSTCGKCFISSNDLWQHNKIHDKVRQYACGECDRSFKTHSNLRTHKLQMHQDPDLWKFVCTVCGKKFPLNNNLIKHMRRHEGIKDFMCHLCDKKFVEKIDLQTHLLSHSNERHFKCDICFKEYKKKETLRRHMKIEHNMGNFVVKKPEKKLNCPMCPKIFAFNNKLQRHILTHTGEKPVKCDCCDKRFRDNYDRNSHLRQVHNIEPKNSMLPD